MRIPIRTTIEEHLLKAVKLRAVEENCGVNDVLEDLIQMYIVIREIHDPHSAKAINGDDFHNSMASEIRVALNGICEKYLMYQNSNLSSFLMDISSAIATAIYDSNFRPKDQ